MIVYIHGGRYEYGTHGDRRAEAPPTHTPASSPSTSATASNSPASPASTTTNPTTTAASTTASSGSNGSSATSSRFGGDPTNVTLVGQSAGATTALWLTRRDHYRGGFRRVMAMSPCFPRASFADRKGTLRMALGKPVTRAALSRMPARALDRGYNRFRTWYAMDMALGPTPLDGRELADIPLWVTSTREEFYHLPAGRRPTPPPPGTTRPGIGEADGHDRVLRHLARRRPEDRPPPHRRAPHRRRPEPPLGLPDRRGGTGARMDERIRPRPRPRPPLRRHPHRLRPRTRPLPRPAAHLHPRRRPAVARVRRGR
ncbi:carboxylesterase family protein [Corynebacterium suedekumii]|nr:carboxylesterase family protein [Corynebacterium suedekumii]